jgi:hypothetical protein
VIVGVRRIPSKRRCPIFNDLLPSFDAASSIGLMIQSFHHRPRVCPQASVAERGLRSRLLSQARMAGTYSPTIIDYPDCAKCGTPTRIVHIGPGKPGYDKRTFICCECNHAEIVFVKYQQKNPPNRWRWASGGAHRVSLESKRTPQLPVCERWKFRRLLGQSL